MPESRSAAERQAESDAANVAESAAESTPNLERWRPSRRILSERLRREQRLRSPRDFGRVRTSGRRASSGTLTLGYARQQESPEPGLTRIGFSVGKRVSKAAVVRNRVRRRLREITRRLLKDIPPGWDLVLTARPSAAAAEYATLERDVRLLLRRARLLSPEVGQGGVDDTVHVTDRGTDE